MGDFLPQGTIEVCHSLYLRKLPFQILLSVLLCETQAVISCQVASFPSLDVRLGIG